MLMAENTFPEEQIALSQSPPPLHIPHAVQEINGKKITVVWVNDRRWMIGVQVASLLERETYNLYRSLKVKNIEVKRATVEQIDYLLKNDIVRTGTRSITFISLDHSISFLSDELRKLEKKKQKSSSAPLTQSNEQAMAQPKRLSPKQQTMMNGKKEYSPASSSESLSSLHLSVAPDLAFSQHAFQISPETPPIKLESSSPSSVSLAQIHPIHGNTLASNSFPSNTGLYSQYPHTAPVQADPQVDSLQNRSNLTLHSYTTGAPYGYDHPQNYYTYSFAPVQSYKPSFSLEPSLSQQAIFSYASTEFQDAWYN